MPLSWVNAVPPQTEQLIRFTHWDVLRKQADINKENYLSTDFWDSYGWDFNTCAFSTGRLTELFIAYQEKQLFDRGKEQFGINLLDIQWELSINQDALILKLAPHLDFKTLDVFLHNNNYVAQKTEGIVYYHLPKKSLENYATTSNLHFSQRNMRSISTIYINREEQVLILGDSPADILPLIKTQQAKTVNKNFDLLDWALLDSTFKDDFTLVVSNRQNKLKSFSTPRTNMDTLCKEAFKLSYKELKSLHPIPLRVIGLNKLSQTTKIMTVYNRPEQATQDQKLREYLVLNANTFMSSQPALWNERYLTYTDTKLRNNCLIYNFSSPQKGCMETILKMRDFPFLITDN